MGIALGIIGTLAGFSLIKNHIIVPIKLKMYLKKYSTSDNVEIVELPEGLYEEKVDRDIIDNVIYEKVYGDFCCRIKSTIKDEDLDNFYRNFKSIDYYKLPLNYIIKSFILKGQIVGGGYNVVENKMSVGKSFLSNSIGALQHELLHASSTYYDKENNIVYSGFSQAFIHTKKDEDSVAYGVGLNEGYTQYLTRKLFLDNKLSKKVYENEQKTVKCLELALGADKMRSLYFRGDLNGLVNELEKYVTRDEINKFINLTDVLLYLENHIDVKLPELTEAKNYVRDFLTKVITGASKNKDDSFTLNVLLPMFLPYNDISNITISSDLLEGVIDSNTEGIKVYKYDKKNTRI